MANEEETLPGENNKNNGEEEVVVNVGDEPSQGRDVHTQDIGDDENDFTPEEVEKLVDEADERL